MRKSLAVGRFGGPEADVRRFSGGWMRQGQIFGDLSPSPRFCFTHYDLQEVIYFVEKLCKQGERKRRGENKFMLTPRAI